MPTGYTSHIYNDEDQTFEEFALECARNFGALITMRDSPHGAEIPDEFTPSDHHVKSLRAAQKTLDHFISLSESHLQFEADEEYQRLETNRLDQEEKQIELKGRYEEMLDKVRAWSPPTPDHEGLKQFMIDQLVESIDFDTRPFKYDTERKSAEVFRAEKISRAVHDIEYHAAEYAKEVERCQERTEWVQALKESLREKAPTT